MKKWIIILGAIIGCGAYLKGWVPTEDVVEGKVGSIPLSINEIDTEIALYEKSFANLKKDNEARIVWATDKKEKTEYSIVYLHGFLASQGEGMPLHTDLGKRFDCNVYLSRLEGHGMANDSALSQLTPESYLASAKRAVAIGKAIGEKVIVIGTSTGGMLGMYLASENPDIAGLILYSPLVEFKDTKTNWLANDLGLKLATLFYGHKKEAFVPDNELGLKYWNKEFDISALGTLAALKQELIKPSVFEKIKCPVFLGYYYKNEEEQDKTVDLNATADMFEHLGTDARMKTKVAFPQAGDHVICSKFTSSAWVEVRNSTIDFLETKMNLTPHKGAFASGDLDFPKRD